MKNDTMIETTTLTSELINAGLAEKKMSIKDLAEAVDITYEHSRRLSRGESLPSKFILREVCKVLGISLQEAERAATADRINKKFGGIPAEMSGKIPSLSAIERVWNSLTEEQQADATAMIQGWARRNRAHAAKS